MGCRPISHWTCELGTETDTRKASPSRLARSLAAHRDTRRHLARTDSVYRRKQKTISRRSSAQDAPTASAFVEDDTAVGRHRFRSLVIAHGTVSMTSRLADGFGRPAWDCCARHHRGCRHARRLGRRFMDAKHTRGVFDLAWPGDRQDARTAVHRILVATKTASAYAG
jgi:hypothetical protein